MKTILLICLFAFALSQFVQPRLRGPAPVGPVPTWGPAPIATRNTTVQWNARPNERSQPAFISAPSPADYRSSPPVAAWDNSHHWGYVEPANLGGWNGY